MRQDSDFPPELDTAFDWAEWRNWRTNVNSNILKLNERISFLENKCVNPCVLNVYKDRKSMEDNTASKDILTCSKPKVQTQSQTTGSFAEADYLGVGYLSTLVAIIRSTLFARFQFLLLFGSAILFLWYGSVTLNRAIRSMQSEFKPGKKDYAINYENSTQVEPYEVPYVYISFFIMLKNSDQNSTNLTDVNAQLLQSQDYFSQRARFRYDDFRNEYAKVSISTFNEGEVVLGADLGVWVRLRLKFSDPSPGRGWFMILLVDIGSLSMIANATIRNVALRISRDEEPAGLPLMLNYNEMDDGMVDIFMIGYRESVTHKYRTNEQYSNFDLTWSQTMKSTAFLATVSNMAIDDSSFIIRIEPNLEVDHWSEYIAFSYSDWLTGMGGLFSLMTTGFLWTSYGLALCCGDGISMGILPGLSFNFFSYEELLWIKNRLGKSGLL